MLQEYQ